MDKRKKKICMVTPEFPPDQWGGLARTVRNVASHAVRLGYDVHVAHYVVDAHGPVLLDENRSTHSTDGLVVHHITVGKERMTHPQRELWDCPHTLTLQMMYQSLELLHGQERFDLFHSFFLYPVGFVTGLLARRMRVPSLVTVVGNDVKRYFFSPEKTAVCRSGLENADCVIGLSRDLIDMADALVPIAAKARVILNSVEIPAEARAPAIGPRVPLRIGCAGIFKYAKGLPYLFKAAADVSRTHPITLELVGTVRASEQEVFDRMVTRTGIGPILKVIDPLPHDGVQRWLRTLDLFVLPSLTEGCPNILMEAMACGVPTVATRTGAMEDLVEDGISGLLVPWGNAEALAGAISKLIESHDFREALGAAARIRMHRFSGEVERESWREVYRKLLQEVRK